jgi:hypothetical protein
MHWAMFIFFNHENGRNGIIDPFFQDRFVCYNLNICHLLTLNYNLYHSGNSSFGSNILLSTIIEILKHSSTSPHFCLDAHRYFDS